MGKEISNLDFFVYSGALPDSPAALSDLKVGDKILSLNHISIRSIEDWNAAVNANRSKRIVEVLRGNQILTVEFDVTVSENAEDTDKVYQ